MSAADVRVLEPELETWERHKAELLATDAERYVLIKGDEVVDTFETESDAIRHGYRKFGNVPFLVKQVVEYEPPAEFSSNILGV